MFFEDIEVSGFLSYSERRKKLVQLIKKEFPNVDKGLVILFANFERPDTLFAQESSFYYFSGIKEPGAVLLIDMSEDSILYLPNCYEERAKWTSFALEPTTENAQSLKLKDIRVLGQKTTGYNIYPYFDKTQYENILSLLEKHSSDGGMFFVLNPDSAHQYVEQRLVLHRLKAFIPQMVDHCLIDVSSIVSQMRRVKDIVEVEKITDSVNITLVAHDAASKAIGDGRSEAEVSAAIEYVFLSYGARRAFPSIIASGKNSVILHYTENSSRMRDGQLVIVDIGAYSDNYCADITRTYPVNGAFSNRQKELYQVVLDAQNYIASIARPGFYILNKDEKDKSLHHLAKVFLKEKGYDRYFPHGIGHFLGLDIHDVGNFSNPLQEGDVITIEPGIYIPSEQLVIRIE